MLLPVTGPDAPHVLDVVQGDHAPAGNIHLAQHGPLGFALSGQRAVFVGTSDRAGGQRELDPLLPTAHAVMMLRIQFERADADTPTGNKSEQAKKSVIASIREYRRFYALSAERTAKMRQGAIVLHPGPINRGIELDADVADGPRSVIMQQVTNGVAVRAAVLSLLVGGPRP